MSGKVVIAVAALTATLAAIDACTSYSEEEPIFVAQDATAPDDATLDAPAKTIDADASPPCDLGAPFLPPEPLANVNTLQADEWCARLSPDGLELYVGVGSEIHRHVRDSKSAPFGPRIPLTTLNALNAPNGNVECPFVMPDGNTLLFDGRKQADAGYDLYVATRSSPVADFSSPRLLGAVNTPEWEWWQWLDGDELYLTARRDGGAQIHRAQRVPGSLDFGPSSRVAELQDPAGAATYAPTLTGDGLTIYFAAGSTMYVARRSSRSDPFGAPVKVPELDRMSPTWVSADGCEIYLFGYLPGAKNTDVFFARKPPKK